MRFQFDSQTPSFNDSPLECYFDDSTRFNVSLYCRVRFIKGCNKKEVVRNVFRKSEVPTSLNKNFTFLIDFYNVTDPRLVIIQQFVFISSFIHPMYFRQYVVFIPKEVEEKEEKEREVAQRSRCKWELCFSRRTLGVR